MDASILSAIELPQLLAAWYDPLITNFWCTIPLLALSGLIGWLLRHLFGGKGPAEELTTLRTQLTTHESQLGSLRSDLTNERSVKSKLETDLGSFRTQVGTLTAELTAAKGAKGALDLELGDLKGKLTVLTKDLAAAKSGHALIETTLKTRDSELADVRSKYAVLQKDLDAAKALHASLNTEMTRLTAVAKSALDLPKIDPAELVRLRKEVSTAITAKAEKELELTATLNQRGVELSKALSARSGLEATMKQRETEVQTQQANFSKLRTEFDSAKTHHGAEIAKYAAAAAAAAAAIKVAESGKGGQEAELTRLRREVATTVSAKAEREQDLTGTLTQRGLDLSKALSARSGLEATMKQRETEVQTQQANFSQLRTEFDSAKTHHGAEIAKYAAAAAAAAAAVKAAEPGKGVHEAELTRLRREVATTVSAKAEREQDLTGTLTQRGQDLGKALSVRGDLEASLKHRETEITAQKTEFSKVQTEYSNLRTRHQQMEAHLRNRENELQAVRDAFSKLQSENEIERKKHLELERLFTHRETEVQTHTASLAKVQSDYQTGQTRYRDLEGQLKSRETDLQTHKANLTKAQADHQAALARHRELEGQLKSRDAEVQTFKSNLAKLQSEHDSIRSKNQELENRLKLRESDAQTQTSSLSKIQAEHQASLARHRELESQIKNREAELSAHKASVSKLQSEVDAAKAHHQSLMADATRLTASTKALEAEKQALQTQLQQAKTQLQTTQSEITRLATTTKSLETEKAGLHSSHQTERQRLAQEAEQHRKDADAARTRLQQLDAEITVARTSLQATQADLAKNSQEVVTLRTNLSQAESERTRLTAEIPKPRTYLTSCPQDLSVVQGIGSIYETRLFENGIGTYSELAGLSREGLTSILQLTDAQKAAFEFDKIRAEAQRLAKETNSLGRRWSGNPPDDMEPLEGIGEVYEGRLYDAGICTYEALCAATPELLAEIIKAPENNKPDYAKWIAQGCRLVKARQVRAKFGNPIRDPNDETPYATNCPQHLSDVKGIGSVFESRLYERGVGTYWELARLSDEVLTTYLELDERLRQSFPFAEMRADALRLAAETKSKGRSWRRVPPDDLEPIHGIGYTYEKRLYDAGFCTYESVCEATPEILDEICLGPKLNKPDYASWITQACTLVGQKARGELVAKAKDSSGRKAAARSADDETPYTTRCPQHMSDVVGIGTVFEGRLYANGVGTYWELSKLSTADFNKYLELNDRQQESFDYNATRADALRLAKESKSKGRKWASEPPDDLEPLAGIGHTFEKRLYDAGICTYAALAEATVEQLNEICRPPAHNIPDFAGWITQAKALAKKN